MDFIQRREKTYPRRQHGYLKAMQRTITEDR
jgi:hypothetical protein